MLISYGGLSNDFLLLDYGFLVPGNPHDTVQLRFDRGLVEVRLFACNAGVCGSAGEGLGRAGCWTGAAACSPNWL